MTKKQLISMKISVKRSTMVKPMGPTPSGSVWLSSLDLLMPGAYHTHSVYFFRPDGTANFFDTAVLTAALSRALVEFYPYAGRLSKGDKGRMEIKCTQDGVLFVEAECDATLDDFGDFHIPRPELRLIPAIDYSQGISTVPLSLLQLTRFKCGGVSLGVANEHHISDGVSGLHFINSWADIAGGLTISVPPLLDRTLLSARKPARPKFPHVEYQPPPSLKTPIQDSETTFSILKFTRDQMRALKAKCQEGSYSSYEVFAGHVWRCVCMARGLPGDQETKLHMPVDGRSRLQPRLPLGYFGNVIFSATPIATCGELVTNPLKYSVDKVHEAISRMDDEYLRSALDYLELQEDVCAMARGPHTTKCPNFSITSWIQLPIYGADFGWGKPAYMGLGAPPFEGKSILQLSLDGSFLYGITLLKQHMNLFQKLFYDI